MESEKTPLEALQELTGRQLILFKKKRAGVTLDKNEVAAIHAGRRKLRAELWKKGIYSKKEFELMASSVGLYFDRNRFWGLLLWLFHGRGLWALLGALALLICTLFLFSLISQMKGHFTINLTDGMFREGFTLSQTKDFSAATTRLLAEPAEQVPCVSVMEIAEDVHKVDGQYTNAPYFAYTFYLRNEGENTADYAWDLTVNSESRALSEATWVMVFENDKMRMFAKAADNGDPEALPAFGDNTRGYPERPFWEYALTPQTLYEEVRTTDYASYYRLIPERFASETRIAEGFGRNVAPMEENKYTVVLWLEGDDPDCTNEKIAGHLGVEMNFRLTSGTAEEGESSWWSVVWRTLRFWES